MLSTDFVNATNALNNNPFKMAIDNGFDHSYIMNSSSINCYTLTSFSARSLSICISIYQTSNISKSVFFASLAFTTFFHSPFRIRNSNFHVSNWSIDVNERLFITWIIIHYDDRRKKCKSCHKQGYSIGNTS